MSEPGDNTTDDEEMSVVESDSSQSKESQTHKCHLCGKEFQTRIALSNHFTVHKRSRSFKCEECGQMCANQGSLKSHIQNVHNPSGLKFKCEECNKPFSSNATLKMHIKRLHSGEKPLKCAYCEMKFSSNYQVKQHERIHTGEKPFFCQYCDETFRTRHSLTIHEMGHRGEKPFKCDICQKSYREKGTLRYHMRAHTKERNFACPRCPKRYKWERDFKKHIAKCQGPKPPKPITIYKCDVCGKVFNGVCPSKYLKLHMRTHTGEKPYQCEICNKRFATRPNYSSHKLYHNEKTLECDHCGRMFRNKFALGKHLKNLQNKTEYKCSHCDKRFTSKPNLINHERVHTGEKPYFCHDCGQAFYNHLQLTKHRRIHKAETRECEICHKDLGSIYALSEHMKIHDEEKPFACHLCPSNFAKLGQMRGHLETCHIDKGLHSCPKCSKRFKYKEERDSHFLSCPGEGEEESSGNILGLCRGSGQEEPGASTDLFMVCAVVIKRIGCIEQAVKRGYTSIHLDGSIISLLEVTKNSCFN